MRLDHILSTNHQLDSVDKGEVVPHEEWTLQDGEEVIGRPSRP